MVAGKKFLTPKSKPTKVVFLAALLWTILLLTPSYLISPGVSQLSNDTFQEGNLPEVPTIHCNPEKTAETLSKLRNRMIIPPNQHLPYNLKGRKPNNDYSQFKEVPGLFQKYFPNKKNGFFLECGAYDGETFSNTLQAEMNLNWTGVLIEPLRENFQALRSKHRRAYILEACLDDVCGIVNKSFSGGGANGMVSKWKTPSEPVVKCVSIADVLSAMDVKHIDWMVLDTEGNEPDIIQSFPFHSVTVDLIQVEVIVDYTMHLENIERLKQNLEFIGFEEDESTNVDMIFRRKSSHLPAHDGRRFGDYKHYWKNLILSVLFRWISIFH